jgi:hypothetical protein
MTGDLALSLRVFFRTTRSREAATMQLTKRVIDPALE